MIQDTVACEDHDLPEARMTGVAVARCRRCFAPFRVRTYLDSRYADSVRSHWVPVHASRWRDRKYRKLLTK